jgi:ABC-type multidrug transport system fused ATPase/permease subunit
MQKLSRIAAIRRRFVKHLAKWRAYFAMQGRFSSYARNHKRDLGRSIACALAVAIAKLLEPWPLKLIIDSVFLDHPLPSPLAVLLPTGAEGRLIVLWVLVASIVVIAVIGGYFYYRQRVFAASAGLAITSDLRADFYAHIQSLSLRFHDNRKTGDLLMRLTSDIRIMREAFISLPVRFAEEAFVLTGMLIMMLIMDAQLTFIAIALLPILFMLVKRNREPMRRAIRKQRQREGRLATMASEVLGGIRVVQGFQREKDEYKKFGRANRKDIRAGLKAARLEGKLRWSTDLAVGIATAAVVGIAALRVIEGALLPGELVVFVIYLRAFYRPLRRLSRTMIRVTRVTAAGERIAEILDRKSDVAELDDARRAPHFRGEISFHDVCFWHRSEAPALNGINLTIPAGQHVAIVGRTGAGKSSLVNLLPRFYDPNSGSVCIDGHDIREFTLKSLREQISIVFQEPILFGVSIADNIGYGKRNTTPELIREAAESAGIAEIIDALPNGFETLVGERGGLLSGGQRQCVAIARAIIRDAPIVILDEPTTGLDPQASAAVLRALEVLKKNRTVIMITHDLRTTHDADRVLVVDHGKIAQDGYLADLSMIDREFQPLGDEGLPKENSSDG